MLPLRIPDEFYNNYEIVENMDIELENDINEEIDDEYPLDHEDDLKYLWIQKSRQMS